MGKKKKQKDTKFNLVVSKRNNSLYLYMLPIVKQEIRFLHYQPVTTDRDRQPIMNLGFPDLSTNPTKAFL